MEHPEEDALVTAMDGTRLDVTIDLNDETVVLQTDSGGYFVLSAGGAISLGDQLRMAARVVRGEEDVEQA